MSGGGGVRGNREVSPLFLLRGGGGGRIATSPEAISKEEGSWRKHGFPHGNEPKARDAHASSPTSASTARTNDPSRTAPATSSMSRDSDRSSPRRGESERTNAWVARTPAPGSSGARNSTAWAPASSSIASARSEFATTCHALSPAAFPIET